MLSLARGLIGQMRYAGLGAASGIDATAYYRAGEAAGIERGVLSVFFPFVEGGLLGGMHRRMNNDA